MKNLLRIVALLSVCLVSFVARGANWDSYLKVKTDPYITATFNDVSDESTATFTIFTPEIEVEGRGRNHLFGGERIRTLTYELKWQYRYGNGSWQTFKSYGKDEWNNKYSSSAPSGSGWKGNLSYTYDKATVYIKDVNNISFTIPIEDAYKSQGTIKVQFRFTWDLRLDLEGDAYHTQSGETEVVEATIYQCIGGKIGVADGTNVPHGTGYIDIYDEDRYKKTHYVQFQNTSEFIGDISKGNAFFVDESGKSWGNLDLIEESYPYTTKKISAEAFEKGCDGSSSVGSDYWKVKKKYVVTNGRPCYSNNVVFCEKFGRVKLENTPSHYAEQKTQYVCNDNTSSKVILQGIKATLPTNHEEDDYELTYKWDYSLDGQTWNEVQTGTNASFAGTELTVNGKFMSTYGNGGSVYFRPKAYLGYFDVDVIPEQNIVYEVIPYTKPTTTNLELKVSDKTVCEGSEFGEGHGIITLKKKYSSDVFNPNITYTIDPSADRFEEVDPSNNEIAKWKISEKLYENTTYTVNVSDAACGTNEVSYETTVKVEKVESDPENEVIIGGCSYEYGDGVIRIQADENATLSFKPASKTNYKYILDDGMNNELTLPVTSIKAKSLFNSATRVHKMYLRKVNNQVNSIKCEGEPITVEIEVVKDIEGNEIWFENKSTVKDNTYYLCKGEKNPAIIGTGESTITGGYGDQTIVWKFKNGKQIPGSENETYSLSAGLFDVTEDCEIVRVIKMGNGAFEDISSSLKIKVYTTPTFSIALNDSVITKGNVCYEEMPILNISYNTEEPKAKDQVGNTTYRIKTSDIDDKSVDSLITGKAKYQGWKFINDATISATQEFCGASVDVSNSMALTVKEDLTFKDVDFDYDCPKLGNRIYIYPKNDKTSIYTFKIGNKEVSNDLVYRWIDVKLPDESDGNENGMEYVNAKVTRTLDGCSKTQTVKIKNVLTPLESRKLYLDGSVDAKSNVVCISKEYKITDGESNAEANVKYKWDRKNNGATIADDKTQNAIVTLSNGNVFYRTRTLGDNCETKVDSIKIDVFEKSTATPAITASATELCYGEEVEVSVDPIDGYKITSWKKNGADQSTTANTIKEFVKSEGDVVYEVEMTSEKCDNYTLTNKKSIEVAPNLKINGTDITVNPADISLSLFDDKTSVITVTLTDTKNLGQTSDAFSFNGSAYKETKVSVGKFTANFSLEDTDLGEDVDMLEGGVYRTYKLSSSKSCVSDTFPINIVPSQGFDAISINVAEEKLRAGEVFYFCDNGTLQLENSEIIYNGEVLKSTEYKLQWYKKTTSGVWFAMTGTDATTSSVAISTKGLESRSEYYKLVVSTTVGGKVYKQSSNVIEVRNVGKPNLNIRLEDGDMNFCYAGNVEFELQTTTWSNPDGVADAKNTFTWQKSYDATNWSDIESGATEDLTVSIYANKEESSLTYVESAMTKATYFRAVLTDVCGTSATSNTLLTKTYKGMDLTAKDVNVMSNKLVQDPDNFEVKFYVNYSDDKVYSYTYYNEDGVVIENKGTASQVFTHDDLNGDSHDYFDYSFGKHKVYVEKVMIDNGCKSDKVEVEYEIIEPLKVDVQMSYTNTCPKAKDQSVNINILYRAGGLPDNGMTATWYYRFDDQEYFRKIDETVIDFTYKLMSNDQENIVNGRIYNINGLDRTCHFYAEIANKGYPIKALKTSTVTMEINPKFEIARATSDKSQYCYGEGVELKAGNVKSSYGEVSYIWKDLNNNKIYPSTETLDLDAIYEQTTFRRIATDECGIKDTSDIDISVREKLEMIADEYEHAKYAEMGKVPYIAVKDLLHVESYMVSHINQDGVKDVREEKSFGSTDLSFGTMPVVEFEIEKYEIYKVDKVGCISVADTFTIAGIEEISAGKIAFERYDSKSINICHGEKIGRIVDEKVANGGSDITYQWFYIEGSEREKVLDDNGYAVTTSVFNADTMKFGVNIATNNEKGSKIKTYAIFRQASMNVIQPDGTYTPYVKYSDTLYVNVAPQLQNSNIENLAGTIKAQTSTYCGSAERSGAIVLTTDEDIIETYYEQKNFGALQFGEEYELYGYWEVSTDKGSKKSYERMSDMVTYEDFDKFYINELDSTTYVRFTITDGCSTTSTNYATLNVLNFDDDNSANYTIDRQAVEEKYIEEGDKIKVTNFENYDNEWYSSKSEKGLIGTDVSITLDSVTFATRLYHKRVNVKNNLTCVEPDYFEIPLNVHSVSKAGRIMSNQQICPDGEFEDIKNYESAFGGTGDFKYHWQITTDTTEACDCWNDIEGEFADTLNYAAYRRYLDGKKTNFIRRTATPKYNDVVVNEKYTRYSNVVALERYKALAVSELAWKDEDAKKAYCSKESVSYIVTDAPTGGAGEYKKSSYDLDWMYSVDGTNWEVYSTSSVIFGGTRELYASGIVYSYFEDKKRDKDVTFYVKAVFTDEKCGVIESKPFSFKVWAETEDPALYVESDSCNSRFVSFTVENKTGYLYQWTAVTDSTNPLKTDFDAKYRMDFDRNPAYMATEYSVQGLHKVSGCKTDIVYFDIDSLPELQQNELAEQSAVLCYGSDLKIEHTAATGGTGTKSYLWQFSYDNEKWNDATATKDFSYEDVRSDIYVRRLVYTDVCPDTITTDAVLYKIADKVEPLKVSIEENMCKNQDMIITLADSMPGNFNVVVYRLSNDTTKETELSLENQKGRIKGNDLSENVFGIVTWDSSYTCKSEMIKNTIKPRPDFTGVESAILSDAEVVCEGSTITITSSTDYTLPGYLKQRIETSKDGKTWSVVKDNSEYQEENKVVVTDTAYYRTILLNGCKDSIISNTVKVGGKNTIANPMTFDVETTSDGEIKIVGNNNVDMAALALVVNDSMEYDFKDKITLAKETEKVVVSSKIGVDGSMVCYTPVSITPMKEGNIFTECLSTGKQIVGEDVINAGSEITYKWYKFGNDTMMYFTDKTDKNYELGVDDEKSRLLRVAYYSADNINYVLKSNILIVNANGPALSKITALEKDSLLAKGLKVTDYYMELNIGMNATLSCFIDDASNGEWQRSDDGISWITADKFDSTHLASQILPIDPKENVYYRVVATNSCGTTTGDSMFVSVEEIPAITEGCLEITLDDCEKTAKIICYDDESKNFRADYYEYYFEVVGECENKTLEGTHGISLSGITGEIEVIVARSYKGVTTKYIKRIDMSKSVGASFSIIAEDVEYGSSEMSGAWLEDVLVTSSAEVSSGTKIQLNNRSENGKSYKWEVYYDGIKMATSLVENPQLYVYNEGVYSFVLTSYSGKCESTANWESGVRVQTGTLRSATIYDVDDFMFEPEFVPLKKKSVVNDIIEVYPTKFDSEIHVSCEGSFSYSIFGTNGMRMAEGEGKDATTINVENLYPGVYTIVVNGSSFRLIK